MKKSKIITLFVLAIVIILAIVIYLFIENSKYYTLHTIIEETYLERKYIVAKDTINNTNNVFEKYAISLKGVKIVDNNGKKVKIDDLSIGDSMDIITKQEVIDLSQPASLRREYIKKIIVTKK